MKPENNLRKDIDQVMNDLEQRAGEVRLKLHLAKMDVQTEWRDRLEPKVFSARQHAKEASFESKAAIQATLEAVRIFADGL
jgi:hypothetical protein